MNLNYTFQTLQTRKFNQTNLITGNTKIITITNRNKLSIEKQLELLNRCDKEHTYTEIPNYYQE
jgi:hypothetical protein